MSYRYIRDFNLNKKILIQLRGELRKAKEDYRVSVKLSLIYDRNSTFKSLTECEAPRDYLVRDGRAVMDLKHKIRMTRFRMKRAIRREGKEVA